ENTPDLAHGQDNFARRDRGGVDIDESSFEGGTGMEAHQLGGAQGGRADHFRMNSLAETDAGLARQVERFYGPANAAVVEVGGFEKDMGCARRHLGFGSAHDTGKGD